MRLINFLLNNYHITLWWIVLGLSVKDLYIALVNGNSVNANYLIIIMLCASTILYLLYLNIEKHDTDSDKV